LSEFIYVQTFGKIGKRYLGRLIRSRSLSFVTSFPFMIRSKYKSREKKNIYAKVIWPPLDICQIDVILFVNFARKEKGKRGETKSWKQVHVGTYWWCGGKYRWMHMYLFYSHIYGWSMVCFIGMFMCRPITTFHLGFSMPFGCLILQGQAKMR